MDSPHFMNTTDPIKQSNATSRTRVILTFLGLLLLVIGVAALYLVASDTPLINPSNMPWVLMGIAVLVVVLGIVAIAASRKNPTEPDYKVFFILGIIFAGAGLSTQNIGMWPLGIVFMVIGLANKDKWKEDEHWKNLPASTKRLKIFLALGLALLVAAGVVFFVLQKPTAI